MHRAGHVGLAILTATAAALVVLCFVWPAAAVLGELLDPQAWSEAALNARRIRLLGRGVGIATAAALIALVLGAGLAGGLAGDRPAWLRSLSVWTGLVVLLTPPYIYAYAWSLALMPKGLSLGAPGAIWFPPWVIHEGRAAWCLGTWTAPVAAAVLANAWRVAGRPAYRLALTDATAWQALRKGALPAMRPWLAIALLIPALLALTEHSVCDLCQAPTWNTEVFAVLQTVGAPGPILAWPLVAIVAAFWLVLWPLRGHVVRFVEDTAGLHSPDSATPTATAGPRAARSLAAAAAAILLVPGLILIAALRDPRALLTMWESFPLEWPHGLRQAAACAAVTVILAIGVDAAASAGRRLSRTAGRTVLVLAAIAAIVPGALVGDAFAAAYVRWPAVGDRWVIVSLVTAARFAIVPMLTLHLAGRAIDPDLMHLANLDGAGRASAYFRVKLALCLPALLIAAATAGLLALTEVPASHLVCPAGVRSVALRLFNDIHYGRNDEIVAMALYLMLFLAAVVAGIRALSAIRRTDGRAAAR